MDQTAGAKILLVEDNPDHAIFTLKALAEGKTAHRAFWVKDGQDALDFLHRRGQWSTTAAAPRPDLILLDINLPKLSGHEVLRHVKGDQNFRSIPVVMLTTSDRGEEVAAMYRGGANSYVKKPVKFTEYVEQIKALREYWIVISTLPAA